MNLVEELRGILAGPRPLAERTDADAAEVVKTMWHDMDGGWSMSSSKRPEGVPKFQDLSVSELETLLASAKKAPQDARSKHAISYVRKQVTARKKKEAAESAPFIGLKDRGLNEVVHAMVNKLGDEVTAERPEDPKVIAKLRTIVASQTAAKVGGVTVDLFSASAAVQVYDALSDANKAHMAGLPIRKMMDIVFKMLARRVV